MRRILLGILALSTATVILSCSGNPAAQGSSNDSPTEAYKRLFKAVKGKETEAIKREMTQKTLDFAKMAAARNNTPIEKMFENGFTATTYSANLPEIRDQRINGEMGSVEVWNSKESKWEDLPFVYEAGAWKFALGELFGGSFKSPGQGRDVLEKQAANAAGNGPAADIAPGANTNVPLMPTANTNSLLPKTAANTAVK